MKDEIRVDDLVMFVDEGIYAKWFYGKMGIIESSSPLKRACRIRWLQPVKYFDSHTSISDFGWDCFKLCTNI